MFRGRPKRWVLPLQPDKDADQHTNLVTLPDTRCRGRWLKKGVVYATPELLADIGCEVNLKINIVYKQAARNVNLALE